MRFITFSSVASSARLRRRRRRPRRRRPRRRRRRRRRRRLRDEARPGMVCDDVFCFPRSACGFQLFIRDSHKNDAQS
jgi:hypothetical protein